MPPQVNPLRLNPLQLKTLALLQELAKAPDAARKEADGSVTVFGFPQPHGDHFHIGRHIVLRRDANGLFLEAPWTALARKGLAVTQFPVAITLTPEALAYETGVREKILHGGHDEASA